MRPSSPNATDESHGEARFDAIIDALSDLNLDEDTAFRVAERMEPFVANVEREARLEGRNSQREITADTGLRI